jgi:type II restriction/modification system DNA methylase subunit YeeA
VLLVRLLFCLFADDTGIFQPAQALRTYIEERTREDGSDLGPLLAQLFQVLNTTEAKRGKVLDDQLAAFPYINGRLFEEPIPIADFDSAMREALLDACALDWSAISPAIFGALFQSIMDKTARRNLGAHYTSEENILKLIKPLFLDALWAEFDKVKKNRNKLFEFHKKLRGLTFFDPACGCGNFLVIAYRELRLLELEILRASLALEREFKQSLIDIFQLLSIDVDQFHGIEIEEFPAQIAQVALWLVDHQMNLKVSEEFGMYFARIPLKTSPHIVHGNALAFDWNDVLPVERASYVMGNPPFVG